MFGLIILIMLRMLFSKFFVKEDNNLFEIETQYDKLSIALMGLIGIGFIIASIMNTDFMTKLNLEWINFMILGLFCIYRSFNLQKSLRLIPRNTEEIEIEDYTLLLNEEVKQIQLFENKIIISKNKSENYEFNELIITEEVKIKLSSWIQTIIPNSQIQIYWNG